MPGVDAFCYPQRKEQGVLNVVREDGLTLLLLAPDVEPKSLPPNLQQQMKSVQGSLTQYKLALDYNCYSYKDALKQLLPPLVTVPTGYEIVGHIAHFNLQEEHWPHRCLIGQVCLDKNRCVKTVVAKLGVVTNEFRTLDMEVIAGENDTRVSLKEHGVKLEFDFQKASGFTKRRHSSILYRMLSLHQTIRFIHSKHHKNKQKHTKNTNQFKQSKHTLFHVQF